MSSHAHKITRLLRSITALAAQLGTPSFVYSAARVRDNLGRLKLALDAAGLGGRSSVLYAMKANRYAPLLTLLKQSGLWGIDACSPQEVEDVGLGGLGRAGC